MPTDFTTQMIGIMFAVVDIQGEQVKVQEGEEVFVNRIAAEEGAKIAFDKVLLLASDDDVTVGAPYTGSKVEATVLGEVKGDKVVVFKKKRRKGYQVKNGHRQLFTRIKVDSITK